MTQEETLNVNLPSEVMDELRKKALNKFGYKRGYIKKATLEAIKEWIEAN